MVTEKPTYALGYLNTQNDNIVRLSFLLVFLQHIGTNGISTVKNAFCRHKTYAAVGAWYCQAVELAVELTLVVKEPLFTIA